MTDNQRAADMFSMYRDWVKTNEDAWNQVLNTSLGTEAFAEALGRAMDNYLLSQNTFTKAMRQYTEEAMRAMNIASAADITRIAELVINLENKIDALADEVEDGGQDAALKGLSDRLSAIERKLNSIVQAQGMATAAAATGDQLTQIERKLDQLVATTATDASTSGNGESTPAPAAEGGAESGRRRATARRTGETV